MSHKVILGKSRPARTHSKMTSIQKHILVPEHIKLSKEEKEEMLNSYNITVRDLPKILISDKAIEELNPKVGDVIKIVRDSKTAGKTHYYRLVIEG